MSSGDYLIRAKAVAEENTLNLPEPAPNSPHLPQEHEKFKQTVEQIQQQATRLEETIKRLRPKPDIEEGVKTTLGQINTVLDQYQQEFDEVQRKAAAEGTSAEDVAKLRSLRHAATPGYTRITFFYQLLVRNDEPSRESTHSHSDVMVEVESIVDPVRGEAVQSSAEWIEQQAEKRAPPPYGITGLFSSSLGDLSEFSKPVELRLTHRGYKVLKLSKLKVLIRDEKWRTILWLDNAESVMLEHRLKRGTVPWTDPAYMKYEVSFPIEQRHIFTLTDVHGIHQDPNVVCPKYEFKNEEEMDRFQACIRERKLLGTYVAARITTDNRMRSTGQFVKLWRTEDDDPRLTFTFWVTEEPGVGHLEFEVARFASISADADKRSVRFRVKESDVKLIGFDRMVIRFKFESDRAPFWDQLKPDISLDTRSRQNSATTTLNSSPRITEQEFAPFDWNLLQSRFPADVNVDNWQDFRDQLPEDIRSNFEFNPPAPGSKAHPTWTFHPQEFSARTAIPLQLKGFTVIIPAPTSSTLLTSGIAASDPRKEQPIDPSMGLDNATVATIFEIYDFAVGFYVFLDGRLQIIVPCEYDVATAYSELPIHFGGLKVSYVEMNLTLTSGSNTKKTSKLSSFFRRGQGSSTGSDVPSSSTLATVDGSTPGLTPRASNNTSALTSLGSPANSTVQPPALKPHDEVEARVRDPLLLWTLPRNTAANHPYLGKIALRVQREGEQYLTISTHILNNAYMMKSTFRSTKRAGASVDDLKNKVGIYLGKQCIGKVHSVFDDDPANHPRGYRSDISLVKTIGDVDIQNVRSPDVRWIEDDEWKTLQTGQVPLELLGRDDSSVPTQPIRNDGERIGRVIGEGYFRQQRPTKPAQSSNQVKDDHIEFFSNCLLYRLHGDWREHSSHSGIPILATLPQSNGRRAVAGFQSFAHRSEMPQSNWDEPTLEDKLRKGVVCFYGAFKIPAEIKEYEICV